MTFFHDAAFKIPDSVNILVTDWQQNLEKTLILVLQRSRSDIIYRTACMHIVCFVYALRMTLYSQGFLDGVQSVFYIALYSV